MVMVHALFFGGHDDDGLVWRRAARGASLDLEERGAVFLALLKLHERNNKYDQSTYLNLIRCRHITRI